MKQIKHRDRAFFGGSLTRELLRFALPVMLSGFLSLTFHAADSIVVGKFSGDTALAAVSSSGPLINLLIGVFGGFSLGTNVLVARSLGRNDHEHVEKTVHTSVLLGVICGLMLAVFGIAAAPRLLQWMFCPENVLRQSVVYLRIYFLGVPGVMIQHFCGAVLYGSGDTRRPMKFQVVAGAVNVVLNLILVIGFGLGVAGVAAATVVSQYLSAGLAVRCLMHETGPMQLDVRRLRIQPAVAGEIVRIGLPASMQGVVVSLSGTVIQSSVNSFGEVVMAGSGASNSLEGYVWIGMNAFYSTCLTFTSRSLGEGDRKRVDQVIARCLIMVVIVGGTLGGLCYLFAPQLLGIFINSPEAIAQGVVRVSLVAAPYFLYGIQDVLVGALRGLGASVTPMVVSVLGMCGFRLVWIATVVKIWHRPAVLYLSYLVSWIITGIVLVICLLVVRRRVYTRMERAAAEEV